MDCTDCSEKLHDYATDELSRADGQLVEMHLATCVACQCELASVRALRAATARLNRESAPQRDLWAGIEAGINCRASARRHTAAKRHFDERRLHIRDEF